MTVMVYIFLEYLNFKRNMFLTMARMLEIINVISKALRQIYRNTMAIIFMNLAPIQALMYIISSLFSFKPLPASLTILLHGLWLKYKGLIMPHILNTGQKY